MAEQIQQPYLGIAFERNKPGCSIVAVSPDGPAAMTDLKAGDSIVRIDGKEVRNFDDFVSIMRTREIGSTIRISYRRATDVRETQCQIGQRPE